MAIIAHLLGNVFSNNTLKTLQILVNYLPPS